MISRQRIHRRITRGTMPSTERITRRSTRDTHRGKEAVAILRRDRTWCRCPPSPCRQLPGWPSPSSGHFWPSPDSSGSSAPFTSGSQASALPSTATGTAWVASPNGRKSLLGAVVVTGSKQEDQPVGLVRAGTRAGPSTSVVLPGYRCAGREWLDTNSGETSFRVREHRTR